LKKLFLAVLAVSLLVGSAWVYAARDPLPCFGECASERGACVGECDGDPECISRCQAAHGRCVSHCN